jgi:hypothetical protein
MMPFLKSKYLLKILLVVFLTIKSSAIYSQELCCGAIIIEVTIDGQPLSQETYDSIRLCSFFVPTEDCVGCGDTTYSIPWFYADSHFEFPIPASGNGVFHLYLQYKNKNMFISFDGINNSGSWNFNSPEIHNVAFNSGRWKLEYEQSIEGDSLNLIVNSDPSNEIVIFPKCDNLMDEIFDIVDIPKLGTLIKKEEPCEYIYGIENRGGFKLDPAKVINGLKCNCDKLDEANAKYVKYAEFRTFGGACYLWNGHLYIYSKEGLVLSVKVYKNGLYIGDTLIEEFEPVNSDKKDPTQAPHYNSCGKNLKDVHPFPDKFGNDYANGFNKIYNIDDHLCLDGEFKNGYLWNGTAYIYDDVKLLIRIEKWKEGRYIGDIPIKD